MEYSSLAIITLNNCPLSFQFIQIESQNLFICSSYSSVILRLKLTATAKKTCSTFYLRRLPVNETLSR